MSVFKKLAGQTAIYGLSSILGRFLNFLLVPIYTRVFHAGEYGVVTQFYTYVTFLNILFTYGLETAYFRFFQSENGNSKVYSTSLISILISSIFFAVLIILFANPLAVLMSNQEQDVEGLAKYVRWFACILACDAIAQIPFARLRQENKAKRFAFLRLVNIFINISLNVFFLMVCPWLSAHQYGGSWLNIIYNPSFGVGYVFLSTLLASVITLVMLLPEITGKSFSFDSILWKRMMLFAFPLMIGGLAGMINETFDRILLPMLIQDKSTSMIQLGIYGACYKLSIIMTLFTQTFRYAAEPFFFSQAKEENAQLVYARVMKYFVMVCSFIFLVVMLYIDVVKCFIGKEYRSGLGVVPILLMANLCIGVYYNLSVWYKINGKARWGAWFTIFGAIITLGFNFWLIPLIGYMGAAWATLICYASMMLICYLAGQHYYPVPYDLRSFFYYIISALVCYLISEFLRNQFASSEKITWFINTVLLLVYVLMAWIIERKKISYIRS